MHADVTGVCRYTLLMAATATPKDGRRQERTLLSLPLHPLTPCASEGQSCTKKLSPLSPERTQSVVAAAPICTHTNPTKRAENSWRTYARKSKHQLRGCTHTHAHGTCPDSVCPRSTEVSSPVMTPSSFVMRCFLNPTDGIGVGSSSMVAALLLLPGLHAETARVFVFNVVDVASYSLFSAAATPIVSSYRQGGWPLSLSLSRTHSSRSVCVCVWCGVQQCTSARRRYIAETQHA